MKIIRNNVLQGSDEEYALKAINLIFLHQIGSVTSMETLIIFRKISFHSYVSIKNFEGVLIVMFSLVLTPIYLKILMISILPTI